jgi:hypothetical protein
MKRLEKPRTSAIFQAAMDWLYTSLQIPFPLWEIFNYNHVLIVKT